MKNKFITIKTTPETLRLLRTLSAITGEKQYEVLSRLLITELNSQNIETKTAY